MLRTPCKTGLDSSRTKSRRPQGTNGHAISPPSKKIFAISSTACWARRVSTTARDIQGITVNRWAHGYAFTPNPLFDPDWKESEKPWVIGRQRVGQIAIANSDAGASAYTDVAIDQAHRAVADSSAVKYRDVLTYGAGAAP